MDKGYSLEIENEELNEYIKAYRITKNTVMKALIEFSNEHKDEIKTRKEIVLELSSKYGFNETSILPADYEIGLRNKLPKLFRRISYGTYVCLGYKKASKDQAFSQIEINNNSLENGEKEKIVNVVAETFKRGFRISSNIDFERFKAFYSERYGHEFEYSISILDYIVTTEAVVFDDRAYIYNDDVIRDICQSVEFLDSPCVHLEAFFKEYSDKLYSHQIFSVEMLKAFILKKCNFSIKYDYIILKDDISPSDLIRNVFNEQEVWSHDELQARLPFLKMETIKQTLNGAEYFRVNKGSYTHTDCINLPSIEGERILSYVEKRLEEQSYVIANELDLPKFESLNPHCSYYTIRDAVFSKFLSHSFAKSGQVITKRGKKLRVLDILEQYCRESESVSLDELNALEAKFDPEGRTHSQCLVAGYNTMVRVNSDLFVSDDKLSFRIQEIDDILSLYCYDNFLPIRKITDFSLFPNSGYSWNHFLLESYLRRFSQFFKFDVRSVNSANIGVMVKKSFAYNEYDDVLSIALANSSVRLSDNKSIGEFLFENGYIGWRNLGKNEKKIVEKAKKIREGVTA